ncbi:sigma-54-dependent Fis family transcriptional regulator [Candidatus Poribacteria bacterium]|nr:sigma-54-dependent Fis family transcriptional regulator [Candidatus Poribacteria bacterium]
MNTILIVDDEKNIQKSLSQGLTLKGYKNTTASSGEEAIKICATEDIDLVLLDIMMEEGIDGVQTLIKLLEQHPELNVVMMSAQQDIEIAVKTMELGAKRYITKPISMDKILSNIEPLMEISRLTKENEILKTQIVDDDEMVGETPAIKRLRSEINQVATSDLGVLITGENGTGKQLVANAIHRHSKRADKPFIPLNCAALPEELVESELFGHERGAFTGADSMRKGRFELADGGTLFLDEIGDMSIKAQAKVLRVLEDGEVERLGSHQIRNVDVRIIAATNKELTTEIERGEFRTDLYYRLKIVPINVPPLRERSDDIPLLVKYFTDRLQLNMGSAPKAFDSEAYSVFQSYNWPGNIRELKNIVERLLIMVNREVILPTDVDSVIPREIDTVDMQGTAATYQSNTPLSTMVDSAEAEYILSALKENNWNIRKTSEVLEVERSNLYKKMHKYNIVRPDTQN